MDMAELEKRITIREDIEAIKQLKARYCSICDDDHNPDKITTLFVEDGIWEGADSAVTRDTLPFERCFRASRSGLVSLNTT